MSPETKKKYLRFKSIRRSYLSLVSILILLFLSSILEILVSNRALVVKHEGKFYFPSYGSVIPGSTFGLDYNYETNYRDLKEKLKEAIHQDSWVLLPLVPFGPNEIDLDDGETAPTPPDLEHYLGTDTAGRDVLARLAYGFRIAIFFSIGLLLCEYALGILIGSMMGYAGGWFDLVMQRLIEIWTNVPFLYVVMIMASIIEPSFLSLIGIIVIFGWTSMTWYMRTEVYREKGRDYVLAAKSLGASPSRVLLKHILPNCMSVVISFVPFSVAGGMVALVSLDFLGFGLPSSYPSIGELLSQGLSNIQSYWIVSSVLVTMICVLTMVTFIGEGVREAFDPKKWSYYK